MIGWRVRGLKSRHLGVCLAGGLTAGLLSAQLAISDESQTALHDPFVLAYADPAPDILRREKAAPSPAIRESITFQVRPGDTLGNLLATAGIVPQEVDGAVHAISEVFDPRDLRAGQEVTISFLDEAAASGRFHLRLATIWLESDLYIEAARLDNGSFTARRSRQATIEDRIFDRDDLLRITVAPGDTIDALLQRAGVEREVSAKAIGALRSLFNPRKLRVGQELFLSLDPLRPERLLGLSLRIGDERFVTVLHEGEGGYSALKTDAPALPDASNPAALAIAPAAASEPAALLASRTSSPLWQALAAHAPVHKPVPDFTLAEIPALDAPSESEIQKLARGDTLMAVVLRAGVEPDDAQAVVDAFKAVYDPRKLQAGQALSFDFGEDLEVGLESLTLDLSPERSVVVSLAEDGRYIASEVQKPVETVSARTSATITSSLYEAANGAGVPVAVMMDLIRIYSFDVDFQREIQRGDSFEILFDRVYTTSGEIVREGPIHYAALTLRGKKLELFRFEMADGRIDYFDTKGQSIKKALMRTPIDGARLSSTYGMREHPILGYSKMHKGVDFAAPKGTPIMAAGDGVIEAIGRNGNYGNYIRIRHDGTYSTAYAHLSKFASGLKKGSRVSQSEIIGYVGSTGNSTGPHLHYEVLADGNQVNPLSVKLPTGEKLAGAELDRFEKERSRIIAMLDESPVLTRLAAGPSQ